jgi:hypothetical protein
MDRIQICVASRVIPRRADGTATLGGALTSQMLNRFRVAIGRDHRMKAAFFSVTHPASVRSLAVYAARDDSNDAYIFSGTLIPRRSSPR